MKKIFIIFIFLLTATAQISAFNANRVDAKLQNLHKIIDRKYISNNKKAKLYELIKSEIEKVKSPKNSKIANYILKNIQKHQIENWLDSFLIDAHESGNLSNYELIQKEFLIGKFPYRAIRSFNQNSKDKLLIVNLENFETSIVYKENIKLKDSVSSSLKSSFKFLQDSLIQNMKLTKNYLQNQWVKHALNPKNDEIYLSADFCPSEKHWFESDILEKFMEKWHKHVAIALTEAWYKNHKKDFAKLIQRQKSWKMYITWVNHTKTHPYHHWVSYDKNFILSHWLNLHNEIVDVEKLLIKYWEIPSIFLRYPWLISNIDIHKKVIYKYNLIPLWADAWLAKWEKPKEWSIVLIHGNKNEPRWIVLMKKLLRSKKWSYWKLEDTVK